MVSDYYKIKFCNPGKACSWIKKQIDMTEKQQSGRLAEFF
jgi:hypothetical protein